MAVLVYNSADLIKAEYALQSAIVSDRDGQNITLTRWCAYKPPLKNTYPDGKAGSGSADWTYPINIMRNRALQLVETLAVLVIDGDFFASDSLRVVAKDGIPWLTDKEALIVPAFKMQLTNASRCTGNQACNNAAIATAMPGVLQAKANLIGAVEEGVLGVANDAFQISPYQPFLAAQTKYRLWWNATEDYEVEPIFESEPYFITTTASILPFDERYVGFGGDKQEHWHRTHCKKPKILVAANHFVVHAVHRH
jgi:hypothetical protein